jgi:hypothetical protein
VLIYLVLAGGRALHDRPDVDEAWFASPALNLLRHGSMFTSIIETRGTAFEGMERYTYWILPVYPVVLAGWFGIAGLGLFTMRAFSVLCGASLVVSMYWIMLGLCRDVRTALVASFLVAVDFACVRSGAIGRMDILCAALGFGGIAIYVQLRNRDLRTAFALAHVLVALSVFTHPNGVLHFAGLMITAGVLDWRRLRPWDMALGAVPYLLLAGAWGAYIAQDPKLFTQQFSGNASGRFAGVGSPITALRREFWLRYLGGARGQLAAKIWLLVPYAAGVFGTLAVRQLRQQRAAQIALTLTSVYFVYDWLLEAAKMHQYVVHIAPLYMALFSVVFVWVWRVRANWRLGAATLALFAVIVHLAGTGYTIRRDSYGSSFRPVVQYVLSLNPQTNLVMASSELAFGIGFDSNLVDDPTLGFNTGLRPKVIVMEGRYKDAMGKFLAENGPLADHLRRVLAGYRRVFQKDEYEVLVAIESAPPGSLR